MPMTPRSRKLSIAPVVLTTITETTISPAAIVDTMLDLYRLTISNASLMGTKVTIRSSTGGAAAQTYWVAAGACVGFSGVLDDALPQAADTSAANVSTNVWTAQLSIAVVDVTINAEFTRNQA